VCTKGRDVISASWWLALTRNSSLKINNCNDLSPSRHDFRRLPSPIGRGELVDRVSVARVQPRTSKGITDLLLPQTSSCLNHEVPLRSILVIDYKQLFSRLRSRSLTELTRQITPPTKNGHAPPPIESRKSYQSVNPSHVWTWWVFPCWVELSRRLHSWWCPSVNSFKFQPCDHTPPGTQRLWFLSRCWRCQNNDLQSLVGIVYG
jgi:hypothetical protein